ncbi:hypothetical protein V5799_029504 [Amblyomma americanum]|uniref:Uncharacterized protein n=1 Tax=Amblyomma americanum TaxID=6943 RepID=A0AAQ4EQY1_AMBAM
MKEEGARRPIQHRVVQFIFRYRNAPHIKAFGPFYLCENVPAWQGDKIFRRDFCGTRSWTFASLSRKAIQELRVYPAARCPFASTLVGNTGRIGGPTTSFLFTGTPCIREFTTAN